MALYNVGFIEVDWSAEDPAVSLISMDVEGREANRIDLRLSDLTFPETR